MEDIEDIDLILGERIKELESHPVQISTRLQNLHEKLLNVYSDSTNGSSIIESEITKLSQLYHDIDYLIDRMYPKMKYSFFPSLEDSPSVTYAMNYLSGTSPNDLFLLHDMKHQLKEVKAAYKQKIVSKERKNLRNVKINDSVVARDPTRKFKLIRGVVISTNENANGTIGVLDIDTGTSQGFSLEDLYEIDEDIISLFALCAHCTLDGDLTDLNKYWTLALSKIFIQTIKCDKLIVKFVKNEKTLTFPPKFNVQVKIQVDHLLNVNEWICDILLPKIKEESKNCCDIQSIIESLPFSYTNPCICIPQGVSARSSTASALESSSLSTFDSGGNQLDNMIESCSMTSFSDSDTDSNINIIIDEASSTPQPMRQPKNELSKVYTTNEKMEPSLESATEDKTKCNNCTVDCSNIIASCPTEILVVPSKNIPITSVIPILAHIPPGETFHHEIRRCSSNSILPTPSEPEIVPYKRTESSTIDKQFGASGDMGYNKEIVVPIARNENNYNSRREMNPAFCNQSKVQYPKTNEFPSIKQVRLNHPVLLLKPGEELSCVITFVESPNNFFVNVINNSIESLVQLEGDLIEYYSAEENRIDLKSIEHERYLLGEYVACQANDNLWYRAQVINWNLGDSNNYIDVMYVDYGNFEMVNFNKIQPLQSKFTKLNIMAQQCHLSNITPSSEGWTKEALDAFTEITADKIELFTLIVQPSSNENSSSLSVKMKNSKGENINEMLVSKGFAYFTEKNKDQIEFNKRRNKELIEKISIELSTNNHQIMILMRGPPGCGKSTKVEQIIKEIQMTYHGITPKSFSADDYFILKNEYQYDYTKIAEAHEWCYGKTKAALECRDSPVFIDNTNIEEFEISNYYNLASNYNYKFYILEPDTDYCFDYKVLTLKNTHNVKKGVIKRMIDRYCYPENSDMDYWNVRC